MVTSQNPVYAPAKLGRNVNTRVTDPSCHGAINLPQTKICVRACIAT